MAGVTHRRASRASGSPQPGLEAIECSARAPSGVLTSLVE